MSSMSRFLADTQEDEIKKIDQCEPYDETRIDYFLRLSNMFLPTSAHMLLDPYDSKLVS